MKPGSHHFGLCDTQSVAIHYYSQKTTQLVAMYPIAQGLTVSMHTVNQQALILGTQSYIQLLIIQPPRYGCSRCTVIQVRKVFIRSGINTKWPAIGHNAHG